MSLSMTKSPLFQDIADITKQPKDKYNSTFESELKVHTVEKDLDYKDGLAVSTMKIYRDYVNQVSDYIELTVSCLLGTYIYDIYPHLDNMEVSLYLTRQLTPQGKPTVVKERYKAVYLLDKNSNIPTNTNISRQDLNQNLPIVFTVQLIDRSAEALRIKMVQGSFDKRINPKNKDMLPSSFIKSVITEQCGKVLIENKPSIDTVTVEPSDNKEQLKSVTIPSGTRLVELPDLIQTRSSGVYNSGIGNYIQRFGVDTKKTVKGYFVYSLYNSKKYNTSEYKIIFYSPPTSNYAITDVTFKYEDKILKVVTHSSATINDMKESLIMSTGGGFRTANANSFTKKPTIMTPQGPKFTKQKLVTEVVYKDRKDGINFAPGKGVSSNIFENSSEILRKSGSTLPLRVTNLDPDFIYPGAACKIVFEGKTKSVEELYGVIHRAVIILDQQAKNMQHMLTSPKISLNSQIDLEIFVTG